MAGEGYALAREELIRTLTAYSGITTADGASDKKSLICSDLIGKNDYLTGKSILIMSGAAQYETEGISSFNSATGEISFGAALSAQIVAGVSFRVLNVLPESIHIKGYDYESGEWRKVRVTGSGEIAIHVTVADIVTAKISGQSVVVTSGEVAMASGTGPILAKISGESVVVTSGQVGILGYYYESSEWKQVRVTQSGEIAIKAEISDIVTARVSGVVAVVSGEVISKVSGQSVVVTSGLVVAKISGQSVVVTSGQVGIKGYELVSGDWRNILVNASGQIIARVSGDVVKISGEAVKVSGQAVKISGQSVVVTSGQVVAKVSGEAVKISGESVVVTSGQVVGKISGESVVVTSGLVVAKISGQSVVVTSGQVVAKISGQTIIAEISSQVVHISGQVVKISGETVAIETPTSVKTGPIQIVTHDSGGQSLYSGAIKSAVVKALTDNSGVIAVGGATDRPWYEAVCSGQGLILDGGEAVSLDVDNFNRVYVVAEVSGEQVSFVGVN